MIRQRNCELPFNYAPGSPERRSERSAGANDFWHVLAHSRYSQSSYMVTNVTKAQAVFSFYGTGVQIFGSKRRNHGYYQITIDTVVYPPANGVSPDTDSFQTPLFTTVALANAYHNVKMQNLGTGNLDLDFVRAAMICSGTNADDMLLRLLGKHRWGR